MRTPGPDIQGCVVFSRNRWTGGLEVMYNRNELK